VSSLCCMTFPVHPILHEFTYSICTALPYLSSLHCMSLHVQPVLYSMTFLVLAVQHDLTCPVCTYSVSLPAQPARHVLTCTVMNLPVQVCSA
jgi:hypothetical protein